MRSPYFLWDSNAGVGKFRTPDSDSESGPKEAGLRLQLQNVMCDMLIVYFMINGENLILLIRCTTEGAASIALDLNDIHMSRYCWLNVQSRSRPIHRVRVPLKRETPTPGLENLGLQTPTLDSDSGPKLKTPSPHP